MSPSDVRASSWGAARLGQALHDLARAAGLAPRAAPVPSPAADVLHDPLRLDRWFEATAEYFGFEAEPVEVPFADVGDLLARAAPCLVRVAGADGEVRALAVCRSSRRTLVVLLPGGARRTVPTEALADLLRGERHPELTETIDRWATALGLPPRKKRGVRRALARELGAASPVGGVWLVRHAPGASFVAQLRQGGEIGRFALFVAVQLAQVAVGLLGWSALFDGSLQGHIERSSLERWVLLSLTVTLLEVLRTYLVGRIRVGLGMVLKRRMLAGALRIDRAEIQRRGSGGLLAMMSESEALESAGVGGALALISGLVALASAAWILALGLGGALHVALLAGWTALVAVAAWRLTRQQRRWIDQRVAMTNALVERMIGHRTRMVQEAPDARHRDEDDELERYLVGSVAVDRTTVLLRAVPSRGWLIAGFLTLIPSMLAGAADPRLLLLSLGGLITAQSAFAGISAAITSILGTSLAWEKAGPLFRAAARPEPYGVPTAAVLDVEGTGGGGRSLEARGVTFAYAAGGPTVLDEVDLALDAGDKVLLTGASGRGKSTLVAVLAGLQTPSRGLVLHHGFDRDTLGAVAWRQRVVSVPQFHDNHLLAGSLLFNLLMGRRWPPTEDDRKLADEVCRDLGLGAVLDRMPAGLEQVVGDTGWQLSHGEKSRVYLARALLQGASVVLVDEGFGALDPESMKRAVDVAVRRTGTLMVIAHP